MQPQSGENYKKTIQQYVLLILALKLFGNFSEKSKLVTFAFFLKTCMWMQ